MPAALEGRRPQAGNRGRLRPSFRVPGGSPAAGGRRPAFQPLGSPGATGRLRQDTKPAARPCQLLVLRCSCVHPAGGPCQPSVASQNSGDLSPTARRASRLGLASVPAFPPLRCPSQGSSLLEARGAGGPPATLLQNAGCGRHPHSGLLGSLGAVLSAWCPQLRAPYPATSSLNSQRLAKASPHGSRVPSPGGNADSPRVIHTATKPETEPPPRPAHGGSSLWGHGIPGHKTGAWVTSVTWAIPQLRRHPVMRCSPVSLDSPPHCGRKARVLSARRFRGGGASQSRAPGRVAGPPGIPGSWGQPANRPECQSGAQGLRVQDAWGLSQGPGAPAWLTDGPELPSRRGRPAFPG